MHVEIENVQTNRTMPFGKMILVFAALIGMMAFFAMANPVMADHIRYIDGVAFFAEPDECTDPVTHNGEDPYLAQKMTGDLQGCLYIFFERGYCSPDGFYWEKGTEIYVGSGAYGDDGTFVTSYIFQANYVDCNTFEVQLDGGCRHMIVSGSGTGDYEGVTGRWNMVDDVATATADYYGVMEFR